MIEKIRDLWVKALRSGKYNQTTGQLAEVQNATEIEFGEADTQQMAFCCLGVLYDVAGAEWLENDNGWSIPFEGDYGCRESNEGDLPVRWLNEFQLTEKDQAHLIHLNDGITHGNRVPNLTAHGTMSKDEAEALEESKTKPGFTAGWEPKTFDEIADYIEANL